MDGAPRPGGGGGGKGDWHRLAAWARGQWRISSKSSHLKDMGKDINFSNLPSLCMVSLLKACVRACLLAYVWVGVGEGKKGGGTWP